jgi:hypothetical protein
MSDPRPSDPDPSVRQGGYMFLLPTAVPEDMVVTDMILAMLPWNAPRCVAMAGQRSADGAPTLTITMEWPITWLRTVEPLPRFELEALLLRRFSSDQALVTGRHAFGVVEPGPDPPDATAQTDAGAIGVESTALTVEGRRGAHGLFMQLRRRIQEQEPVAFSKLAGHMVYVWFDEGSVPVGRPHKHSDETAINALMRALAEYEPKTDQLWRPGGTPPPETAPDLPLSDTPAGASFYAVPITNAAPSTILFTIGGFELGLAYSTLITARGAWDEIQRLVDGHDKPGVDLLVITAGGPDVRGNLFPAEEALARFVASNPLGLSGPPDHIKRVVLHTWGTGEALLLYPDIEQLFPGPYARRTGLSSPVSIEDRAGRAAAPGIIRSEGAGAVGRILRSYAEVCGGFCRQSAMDASACSIQAMPPGTEARAQAPAGPRVHWRARDKRRRSGMFQGGPAAARFIRRAGTP